MTRELTDDDLDRMQARCDAAMHSSEQSMAMLGSMAYTDMPRLISEVRRLRELCDENGIEWGPPEPPLEQQPCGCRFDGWELTPCNAHKPPAYIREVHFPEGRIQRWDETGFCYCEISPIPSDVQARVDEVFARRQSEGSDVE